MDETQYNLILGAVRAISSRASIVLGTAVEQDYNFYNNFFDFKQELSMKDKIDHTLKSVFGYDSFRPMQREVIQNVLDGRDTVAVMPTGGGKSICYQVPALLLKGITIVVSPLISLMQDQVFQLEALGVPALFLNSTLDRDTYFDSCRKIRSGEIKLLYVSPEKLNTSRMQDLLHSENISVDCITIDEAHCISEWGHDFRPDYLEIASIREQFPKAVCLALTATATKIVQNDIAKILKMENPSILVSSFNRPNLYLEVKRKNSPFNQLMEFLIERKDQSGIIYCMSRKHVDELYEELSNRGFSVSNYHAGLPDEKRTKHQNDFIQGRTDIMVATVAFGMGINKPDVRFVVHYDLPKSIEQYYQEIGRAGRDGLPASTLLLYSGSDIHRIKYFFAEKEDSSKDQRLLQGIINYAEARTCRRHFLLTYFGENYDPMDSDQNQCCCDVCTNGDSDDLDYTIPSQKYMSCVLRTKQKYGASYIIDVLMGSKSKRIMDNGDNKLSTWGIGKDLSKQDWLELNSCLLDAGYLNKSDDYNVLSVTPYGYQSLMERRKILLPLQLGEKKTITSFPKTKKKKNVFLIDENDEEAIRIVEELRSWRRKLSDEQNIPPYAIFGDKTMFDIAVKKPTTKEELLHCSGIGEGKAEKFGSAILRIVNNE